MRQGQQSNRSNRQQRGRGRRQNNSSGGNPSNKVYDSNGPDVRVRGSAQTVADKYLQLAGDAQSQGDQIKTESYFQYAEHYLRIVAANQTEKEQRQAEKDKAAEEHTARMQVKKEKAAAELGRKATLADAESNTQPRVENGAESGNDDWGGHQPAFLQREEDESSEKPKKPRRKPTKKKIIAKEVAKDDGDAGSVETPAVPESEAEVTGVS